MKLTDKQYLTVVFEYTGKMPFFQIDQIVNGAKIVGIMADDSLSVIDEMEQKVEEFERWRYE